MMTEKQNEKINQTAVNSQRYSEQIRQQYQLLEKGNSALNLISLVERFEVDPKAESIDRSEVHYLIIGNIVEANWLEVKHLNDSCGPIVELAIHAVNEELTEFCTLFPKVASKLKEVDNNYVKLNTFDAILEKAKLSFVLKVYKKYFATLEVSTVTKTTGCKEEQIKELGYKVEGGYVDFGIEDVKISQGTQEVLLEKMRNLVAVADQMSTFEQ